MPPRILHQIFDDIEKKLCKGVLCIKEDPEGIWLELDKFGKQSRNKFDGLRTECKRCRNSKEDKPKKVKQSRDAGRPIKWTSEKIEELLNKYGLFVLENIDATKPSKAQISFCCEIGHEDKMRFDVLQSYVKKVDDGTRHKVCRECQKESDKVLAFLTNESLVEEKGFLLQYMSNSARGDILYDILCENGHVTTGRTKSSFLRSFSCKECLKEAPEIYCQGVCKELLPRSYFNNYKSSFNGKDHVCRECRQNERKNRKEKDEKMSSKPKLIIDDVEGKECSTEDCGFHSYTEYPKDDTCKDGFDKYCKSCKYAKNKEYQEKNKEKLKIYRKKYNTENREKSKQRSSKWREKNREKYKEWCRNYSKKRRRDPSFKVLDNLRSRLYHAMKGRTKSATTLTLLGCSIEKLWDHLEAHFEDPMTRENYGPVWHVDHIKPCSIFDLTDDRQQRQCFNWRNLQPLLSEENISKGNNYDPGDYQHERFLEKIT